MKKYEVEVVGELEEEDVYETVTAVQFAENETEAVQLASEYLLNTHPWVGIVSTKAKEIKEDLEWPNM